MYIFVLLFLSRGRDVKSSGKYSHQRRASSSGTARDDHVDVHFLSKVKI